MKQRLQCEVKSMCGGVEAREAAIPVLLEGSGQLDWIVWGRRKEQPGYGPPGGWAKLSTVEAGGWAKYHPRRAFSLVQRFMEKEGRTGERNRISHWFDVPEGYALECLLIGEGEQRRVYVITTEPPTEYAWIHDRWPVLTALKVE